MKCISVTFKELETLLDEWHFLNQKTGNGVYQGSLTRQQFKFDFVLNKINELSEIRQKLSTIALNKELNKHKAIFITFCVKKVCSLKK